MIRNQDHITISNHESEDEANGLSQSSVYIENNTVHGKIENRIKPNNIGLFTW